MTLKQWADNGWLRPHKSSRQEVANLWAIVRRDLEDARSGDISDDWRFGIAYNAVLKLCTITGSGAVLISFFQRHVPYP